MTRPTASPANLSLVHRTRFPPAPPEGAAVPTLLALHGRGSDDGDLLGLAPYLDDRLLWISPRAPLELEGGFEWYRLRSLLNPDQASFDAALSTLARFIAESFEAYPIDPERFFLFGFSQGGMMAYSHTLRHPGQVAGVIAHSSYIPMPSLEAAGQPLDLAGQRGRPYLLLHGTRDPMIPVGRGRQARDTLTAAGADVAYHEFPGAHHVSDRSLAAMDWWLQAQLEKAGQRG